MAILCKQVKFMAKEKHLQQTQSYHLYYISPIGAIWLNNIVKTTSVQADIIVICLSFKLIYEYFMTFYWISCDIIHFLLPCHNISRRDSYITSVSMMLLVIAA